MALAVGLLTMALLGTQGAARTCGSSADAVAVVQAQMEAYSRHDLDGFAVYEVKDGKIVNAWFPLK